MYLQRVFAVRLFKKRTLSSLQHTRFRLELILGELINLFKPNPNLKYPYVIINFYHQLYFYKILVADLKTW